MEMVRKPIRPLGLVALALFTWLRCGQKPSGNQPTSPQLVFQCFSGSTAKQYGEPGNWCDAHFPEAPVLTGDPLNSVLRRFILTTGIYIVTVRFGHVASSFMVQKHADNPIVQLFTSNNFYCLGNHQYFDLSPDNTCFTYNNHHSIQYTATLENTTAGIGVAITYDPGNNYGITVRKCEDCL